MGRRSERGSATALALVLVLLVGAVAWNYRRNLAAEQSELRPYRSYSEADLAALIDAYEAAGEQAETRYDAARARRSEPGATGDLMQNVRAFERAQSTGRATRAAREDLAEARASLEGLRAERARRAAERSRLRLHARRAFSF